MLDAGDISGATWPVAIVAIVGAVERIIAAVKSARMRRAYAATCAAVDAFKSTWGTRDPILARGLTNAIAERVAEAGAGARRAHTRMLERHDLNATRILGPEIAKRTASGEYAPKREAKPPGEYGA